MPPRHRFVRVLALVVSLGVVFAVARPVAAADDPQKLYEEGRKAERAGHMARAYLLYSQAAELEPQNQLYWLRSQAVQSRAALESPPKAPEVSAKASDAVARASADSIFDALTPKDRVAERQPQPPVELQGTPGRQDFDLRADAKSLWEQVAGALGLDTVFDGDYQPGPQIRFRLTASDYRETLHALEAATGSFIVPISKRLFLVVKDTEQKRREVEPTEVVAVQVPQATALQELTEIVTGVRQLFMLEHIAWDSSQNMIVMRDRVSRVVPARTVVEELLHHRPQVEIELELLEVDRTNSLAYGVDLPTSFPLINLSHFWNSIPSISQGIASLAVFGGGYTQFGIAIANAAIQASLTRSTARTLVRTSIRAIDSLPASVHVGDRFPILSSGYFGPASFQTGGQVYTPPPSFTFEDLGVSFKVTPHIHGMDEVSLELETEFKVLTGSSLNGIPVISNRKLNSKVRLREGEWGVIAGLMSSSEARTIHGLPWLSGVPVLGQLLRTHTKETDTADVLLLIKPTLLNLPPDQYVTPTIWTGSEMRPVTPL
jgi:general secretion pathway protein D